MARLQTKRDSRRVDCPNPAAHTASKQARARVIRFHRAHTGRATHKHTDVRATPGRHCRFGNKNSTTCTRSCRSSVTTKVKPARSSRPDGQLGRRFATTVWGPEASRLTRIQANTVTTSVSSKSDRVRMSVPPRFSQVLGDGRSEDRGRAKRRVCSAKGGGFATSPAGARIA